MFWASSILFMGRPDFRASITDCLPSMVSAIKLSLCHTVLVQKGLDFIPVSLERLELSPHCLEGTPYKATAVNNLNLVGQYASCRKAERGLTPMGEKWIHATMDKFALAMARGNRSLLTVDRDTIREFLASVNGVWNRHSFFRAVRAFYNWLEREGRIKLSPCHIS